MLVLLHLQRYATDVAAYSFSPAGFWDDAIVANIDDEYDQLIRRVHNIAGKGESINTIERAPTTLRG
ncbi:hypothetical protein Y032_0215g2372 [Ancylostoma ceylanicum]|uniref:Uncharacterized protein n=1 Tax=Ancylostoma ceylanicum TaxID=53326 RepID=A0A016SK59_9BILA|nr:hypothetical protein Y032_0215g2372 [Ancylostoma ceylanicum]